MAPSGAEGLLWRNSGEGQGIAMGAPTHRVKAHGTGLVTHNYGSAGSATYQMAAAEVLLQEAVGLREGDWRAVRLGAMQERLGRFSGSIRSAGFGEMRAEDKVEDS